MTTVTGQQRYVARRVAALIKQGFRVVRQHQHMFKWRDDREWSYLSYSDYEGVLMGMDYPELKIWAFCRGSRRG